MTADFHFQFRSLFAAVFFCSMFVPQPFFKKPFFESTTFFLQCFCSFTSAACLTQVFAIAFSFRSPFCEAIFLQTSTFNSAACFLQFFLQHVCSAVLFKKKILQLSNFFSSSIFSLSLRQPVCRRFCYSIFFPQPLL